MTSVALIYLNNSRTIHLGLAYISSMLKQHNHKVVLYDTAFISVKEVLKEMEQSDARIAMFSVHSIVYKQAVELSKKLKKIRPDITILFGGWHVLIDPEDVIKNDSVDMLCVGEGEYVACDVADNIDQPDKLKNILNIWYKKNSVVVKNPIRVLDDIDKLPLPDRDIFDRRCLSDVSGLFHFLTMRGCPYRCSFCCNYKMLDLYKDIKSCYIRFRSIDKIIEEMKYVKDKYGPKEFFFTDEMFLTNHKRVKEFCRKYMDASIGIPFGFMARVEHVDEGIIKLLKEAGCSRIHFGVESGNEEIRRKYLNRNMSNQQIIDAFNLCHLYDIKTASFNMIGIPFETKETIEDTFKINQIVRPTVFQCTILYPFVGTEIRDIYKDNNLLDERIEDDNVKNNYYSSCITHSPYVNFSYIKHMQIFMNIYFNYSVWFARLSRYVPFWLLDKYNYVVKHVVEGVGR